VLGSIGSIGGLLVALRAKGGKVVQVLGCCGAKLVWVGNMGVFCWIMARWGVLRLR